MNSLNFYLGLWAGKAAIAAFSRMGRKNDDRPGLLARKFDIDFIKHASKPEHVLLVTGTNGKSSITNMINSIYKDLGYRTGCNESGNNTFAGEAWVLLKSNNIFNRPAVDAIVMEADELYSRITFPQIKPSHLIISNLGRDSMFKNANPEIPAESLKQALKQLPETVVFLNGDDPLSCFLRKGPNTIYYGVADMHAKMKTPISNDFGICPVCGAIPEYHYRNYRHIGNFTCPRCGLKSPEKDYLCTRIDEDSITVKDKEGSFQYPLISDTIYNIYNEVAIIAYFRELNYTPKEVSSMLSKIKLPDIREERVTVGNIEVIRRAMKGQNASAASTVLQSLISQPGDKEIILMEDEIPDETSIETICWIWDTDFEYLKDDKIKRIIISGKRHLDHSVRLLCAGIDEDIMIDFEEDEEIPQHLMIDGIDKIYILYDIMALSRSRKVMERVIAALKGENNES